MKLQFLNSKHRSVKKPFRIFFFSLLTLTALPGCGGGTSGTGIEGGSVSPIEGRVVDNQGQPIANAEISVEGTETTVVSDEQGNFTIDSLPADSPVNVIVGTSSFPGEVDYPDQSVSSTEDLQSGVVITINPDYGSDTALSCLTNDNCEGGAFCQYEPSQCNSAAREGTCLLKPEVCPEIWGPVCGCDGKTYSSECFAYGAGMSIAKQGTCEGGED